MVIYGFGSDHRPPMQALPHFSFLNIARKGCSCGVYYYWNLGILAFMMEILHCLFHLDHGCNVALVVRVALSTSKNSNSEIAYSNYLV
jgi:hypothetical protein